MSNNKKQRNKRIMQYIENVDADEISDSENEYTETERNLLKKVRTSRAVQNFDSDDEVFGLQSTNDKSEDEDNDDDEGEDEQDDEVASMDFDIEGLQEDYDLPNERAWGKKKKAYYSTDYVDPDYSSTNQKNLASAELEEEEARNIQKRLAEQLDDIDFGLDYVQVDDYKKKEEYEEVVKTDFTKLSKRQKQILIQKESPEFEDLINDFKDYLTEAKNILAPFLQLIQDGVCSDCSAVTFVKLKYQLALNYCVNISFYLMLKAKRLPVNTHPVIKRLVQYRELLNQLQSSQDNLMEEIREILKIKKDGGALYNVFDGTVIVTDKKRQNINALNKKVDYQNRFSKIVENADESKVEDIIEETEDDKSDINQYSMEHEEVKYMLSNPNMEGKRSITYQIAKNKGLTPSRKKEQRNPRVKHRNKYRKAKIRRKGAVREIRKELSRYKGEISGIKASIKKSIKLK